VEVGTDIIDGAGDMYDREFLLGLEYGNPRCSEDIRLERRITPNDLGFLRH
jgi:hypothetical protein